ncbi:MAG: aldolase [Methanosarcinales archaeon]|nr:aldolase [Methanosarcinales archaeon]
MSPQSKERVPLDVPPDLREEYLDNLRAVTHGSGRLMLFAGDQKVEHLNADFYGPDIHPDDANPEHLFRIASQGRIGAFAAQMGLIARYGQDYPKVPYLVKLNSKTNLVPTTQAEPFSSQWYDICQVLNFKENSGLCIHGVGYTIYLGSEDEALMLREAAQIVHQAHESGLLTVLWIYPRGQAVTNEKDPHLIAGATGVAAALGSDFVKVNYPREKGPSGEDLSAQSFREAVLAAGRTGVICAGGASEDVGQFLRRLHDQIHVSGAAGNATGRNIHQKSLDQAVRMCNAIYAVTVENRGVDEALAIYQS